MIVGLFLFIIVNWGYVNKTELLEKKKKKPKMSHGVSLLFLGDRAGSE